MTGTIKRILRGLLMRFRGLDKYGYEENHWRYCINSFQSWYLGEIKERCSCKAPLEHQKIKVGNTKDSAVLTWFELHQKPKYLHDLRLREDALSGLVVLDVGSGPIPSGLAFKNCKIYCLDPLYDRYLKAGYPLHYYDNVRFVHGFSENMPLQDNMFDAVISVNAIDHVDDLKKTSSEIKRVLKEGGKFIMHVHYHKPTLTEPIEINDKIFADAFSWCKGLRKVNESNTKLGAVAGEGEVYVLWSNFQTVQ